MRKGITLLFCGLLILAIVALPGRGQAQEPTRQDVSRALVKLDQQIADVRDLLQAFHNLQAEELLRKAMQMRQQAANRLHPRQAMMDIQLALQLVEQAVRAALEGPLQRMRSQLEELMRRAENEVIGSGNREAEELLQQAKKSQAAALEALRVMAYRKAIEYYRLAIHLAEKSIGLVGGLRQGARREAIDIEREQFALLAARALEAVENSKNPVAREIYEQAMKQGHGAEAAMRNGHPAMALRLYSGATRLLLRAIDLVASSDMDIAGRLESELALLEDLIARAEQQIAATPDEQAKSLITRARMMVNEARRALEQGHIKEAEWRLALARSLVSKAMRAETGSAPFFESRLEEELAQLNADIADLDRRAHEQQHGEAVDLVMLARVAAGRAERAATSGRPRVALQALLAAQRFLNGAEMMLSRAADQPLDSDEVAQRLERLDASLQEVERAAGASGNEMAMELVREATEIRDRAREAFNRGRLRVASESTAVAMEMLRTVLKLSTSDAYPPEE